MNVRLQPPHASLIGGDRRSSSGSLVKFTANRRASSRCQPICSPSDATQRYVRNRGRSGSARVALETMTTGTPFCNPSLMATNLARFTLPGSQATLSEERLHLMQAGARRRQTLGATIACFGGGAEAP